MKSRLVSIFLLCPVIAFAQNEKRDSIKFYEKAMSQMRKEMMDSMMRSETFRNLSENARRLRSQSDDYTSFNIFYQAVAADFSSFNKSIAANGFPALHELMNSFGISITSKKGRRVFDFTAFSFGLPEKSKKNDERVIASVSSIYNFDWGYDFIKSPGINFFPYAGFGFRTSSLSFEKPIQTNSSFTNITNLITNNQSVSGTSLKFTLNAGVGFDFRLNANQRNNLGGMMAFLKAGVNIPVGNEKYKIERAPDYNPGIKYGKWVLTAGIKFFGR